MLEVLVAGSNRGGFDLRAFFSYLNAKFLFAFFEVCVPQTAVIAEERECGVAFSENGFVSVFAVFGPVIVVAFVGLLVTNLIIEHGQHLVRHDKDIEVLQKSDERQDESIDKIKENANELKTDMRLIEQRIDLTSGNSEQSKPNKNKK